MKNRSSRKLAFVPRPYCTKQISIRGEHLLLLFLLSFLKIDCWIRPKKRTILYRRVGGRPPPQKKRRATPQQRTRTGNACQKTTFFLASYCGIKGGGASLAEKIGVAINREWKWVQKSKNRPCISISIHPSVHPTDTALNPSS